MAFFYLYVNMVGNKTSHRGEKMEKNMQYLYEYHGEDRVRNVGLVRTEQQMDKCIIQVYAKQIDQVKGILFQKDSGETYLGCWEAGLLVAEEVEEYLPSSNVKYEKIKRQELSRLPRKEWRLANNSFLLHGYHNYHHLLYIEEEEGVWIGVPGIYHEKEKQAAAAFGFQEFRRKGDIQIELEKEEENVYEDFGYWCRQISFS